MIKILIMFKFAYCDLYSTVKAKMIFFIVFYEVFLFYRAFAYCFMQFYRNKIFGTGWYTFFRIMDYTTEISLIFAISLISFKNEQEEDDDIRTGTV